MTIKLIFPTKTADRKVLQHHIDHLHCYMIITALNALNLSYEEKIQLLQDVQLHIKLQNSDSN